MREKYVWETERKLQVRVKEHRSETEKVSKGTNYTRDKKKKTIKNGDVGVSYNRQCNARKSSYRLGKRTNHRESKR